MHPSHSFAICDLEPASLRNILDNVSAPDALMWSQTNRFWRRLCREHFRSKLVTLLKVYLDDAQSFRELMRATGSVLGGSEAIDFALQGSNLPRLFPHDLDIFVGVFHALQVVVYLRDREGYRVFPDDSGSPYLWIYDREFGRVETVVLVHLKKRTRIQVVCCSRSTPLFSVVQNWSTLHMTILTADMLVVPYPTLTFAGEGLFTEVHSNDGCARGRKAAGYRRRGFRIGDFSRNRVDESDPDDVRREQVLNHPAYASTQVMVHGHSCTLVPYNCPGELRGFSDPGTFRFSFDDSPTRPTIPNPSVQWVVAGSCGGADRCARVGREIGKATSLLGSMSVILGTQLNRFPPDAVAAGADVVPELESDMMRWCRLSLRDVTASDQSAPLEVVYTTTGLPVRIRVQGVYCDGMQPLSGHESRRTRANTRNPDDEVQYLRLVGAFRDMDDPFRHQVVVLSMLIHTIFHCLGVASPVTFVNSNSLTLRRRLYDTSVAFDVEDATGYRTRYCAVDLRQGDLVEVFISFEIFLARCEDGLPRTHVFLSFEHITLLHCPSRIRQAIENGPLRPIVFVQDDYLDFGNIGYTEEEPIYGEGDDEESDEDEDDGEGEDDGTNGDEGDSGDGGDNEDEDEDGSGSVGNVGDEDGHGDGDGDDDGGDGGDGYESRWQAEFEDNLMRELVTFGNATAMRADLALCVAEGKTGREKFGGRRPDNVLDL